MGSQSTRFAMITTSIPAEVHAALALYFANWKAIPTQTSRPTTLSPNASPRLREARQFFFGGLPLVGPRTGANSDSDETMESLVRETRASGSGVSGSNLAALPRPRHCDCDGRRHPLGNLRAASSKDSGLSPVHRGRRPNRHATLASPVRRGRAGDGPPRPTTRPSRGALPVPPAPWRCPAPRATLAPCRATTPASTPQSVMSAPAANPPNYRTWYQSGTTAAQFRHHCSATSAPLQPPARRFKSPLQLVT